MPRERFKTLTEQMFYILLCLHQERRGVEILEMVRTLTADRVSIGSGTLYDLLEQFTAEGMIQEVRAEGRRRSYIITEKGRQMLDREYRRIRSQAADYEHLQVKDMLLKEAIEDRRAEDARAARTFGASGEAPQEV